MPEPTSDAWTQIRYDYEHTGRPVEDICAEHGISSGTLRDRVRRWRWNRRRAPIPRQGPPALAAVHQSQTSHPAPTVFAGAQTVDPPPPGEGDDRAAVPQLPSNGDPAAIAPRLQGAVARVLPAIESIIARLSAGPLAPREMEQTARALGTLTRTLRELNALLAQHPAPAAADDDPIPEDIDEFRFELARRIRAFIAARQDAREAAPEPEGDP